MEHIAEGLTDWIREEDCRYEARLMADQLARKKREEEAAALAEAGDGGEALDPAGGKDKKGKDKKDKKAGGGRKASPAK